MYIAGEISTAQILGLEQSLILAKDIEHAGTLGYKVLFSFIFICLFANECPGLLQECERNDKCLDCGIQHAAAIVNG